MMPIRGASCMRVGSYPIYAAHAYLPAAARSPTVDQSHQQIELAKRQVEEQRTNIRTPV